VNVELRCVVALAAKGHPSLKLLPTA